MNILSIPYFAGGLSHLIPLYVLHHKYLRKNAECENHFLVNNHLQNFLKIQGINCVTTNFFDNKNESIIMSKDNLEITKYVAEKEKEAYDKIKPILIIEDTSVTSPLIAEKNNIPRISIQRTGNFRSIDKCFRNVNHVHSLQKGQYTEKSLYISNTTNLDKQTFNHSDSFFLEHYLRAKAKIIPGIPTIECLPEDIENRKSYFYSGPLIIMDRLSKNLSIKLNEFLSINKQKSIVFITTGTIDKTPIEDFIKFFVKRNYAIITTCDCKINEEYKQEVFYNKLFPLNHICGISDLVIHQCGSGMYHYPIINRVPSLTLGTFCYDREDIAQRLQQLEVSGHIPHPDDNPNYWDIFLELVDKFEKKTLVDFNMMDKLRLEINEVTSNFQMEEVIKYAIK